MKQQITKEGIRKLINQGDLKNALEALVNIEIGNVQHSNQVIVLNSRLNKLTQSINIGVITRKREAIAKGGIIQDALNLLEKISIPDATQGILESKSLIANGKIDEAFDYLKNFVSDLALLDEIDKLNNIHQENKNAARLGLVTLGEEQIQINKVSYVLLSIINRIERKNEKTPIENFVPPKEMGQKTSFKKNEQRANQDAGLKEAIKTLIIENDLTGAIEELNKIEIKDWHIENEIVMLNSRVNQLKQDFEKNFISHENYNVMNTRLKRTVLYLVNHLELG